MNDEESNETENLKKNMTVLEDLVRSGFTGSNTLAGHYIDSGNGCIRCASEDRGLKSATNN